MLTIRRPQLHELSAQRVDLFRREMLARVQVQHADTCAALGAQEASALVKACIDECRRLGAPGRESIVDALDSVFQNADLPTMGRVAAIRSVAAELDARRLCSMLETAAGLPAA